MLSDFSIWLLNKGDSELDISACELFGFNVGSFAEKAAGPQLVSLLRRVVLPLPGTCRGGLDNALPWMCETDHGLMVQVADTKKPICFANLACQAASSQGLTELSMVDHDVAQVTQD